jgi:hypothetical protein
MVVRDTPGRRRAAGVTSALVLLGMLGCSKADSHGALERELKVQEEAAGSLETQAVKMEKKSTGLGPAWAVNLSGRTITPATFDSLARAGKIVELNLSNTHLTDADMKRVSSVADVCTHLDLSNNDITDSGLGELKFLLFLRELNLAGTKCTQAGADALKKRLAAHPVFKANPTVKLK